MDSQDLISVNDQNAICYILNGCIQPAPDSIQRAAFALDNLRPRTARGVTDETFARGFWQTFLKYARQIHCNNQDYLATVVKQLTALPPQNQGTGNFWTHLPGLRKAIEDMWDGKTYIPRTKSFGIPGMGLKAMRRAFEDNQSENARVRECRMQAAAQWIFYSAPNLYELMECNPSEHDQRKHHSTQFLGTDVFSLRRWMFWKRALIDLCTQVDYAARAVEFMDAVDGGQ
ncbi:hypothetical protein F5Y00DRAFT_266569 [Daldinia vernicosa]|uniref:uncharacterized protein n=1 Tax=Daldinia vernicosa TaxID=114800 RepID=UPI0020087051|nr:uncharacterized protein F5Y00DRAFT_266569 [Daldinia vernicosa]KAI0844411.1 hypothetical protein F5Y00DRAFT_266569 [Daldinia vernicosa]